MRILPHYIAPILVLLLAEVVKSTAQAFNPFRGSIELGKTVEPSGTIDFGILENGQFRNYQVKGYVTKHLYLLPEDRSRDEIFFEIQALLSRDNYVTLVSHRDTSPASERIEISEEHFVRNFDHDQMILTEDRRLITLNSQPAKTGGFYVSARQHTLDKDTYAVATMSNGHNYLQIDRVEVVHRVAPIVHKEVKITESITPQNGGTVEVIETVVLTSERIRMEVEEKGHVNIYGIHFDVDSATIQPRSHSTLAVMAEYLREHPQYSYYVIGHTSDTGSFEHNMKLSVDRSQAVIDDLVGNHEIDGRRLTGYGVGPVAPIDSNYSSGGRAHNRRVVLIRRLPNP